MSLFHLTPDVRFRLFDFLAYKPELCRLIYTCRGSKDELGTCIVKIKVCIGNLGNPLTYPRMAIVAHIDCPVLRDNDVDPFCLWYEMLSGLRASSVTSLYITAPGLGFYIFEELVFFIYELLSDVDIAFVDIDIKRGLLLYGNFFYTDPTHSRVRSRCRVLLRQVEELRIVLGIRVGLWKYTRFPFYFPRLAHLDV